jgi:hypothetical protein
MYLLEKYNHEYQGKNTYTLLNPKQAQYSDFMMNKQIFQKYNYINSIHFILAYYLINY